MKRGPTLGSLGEGWLLRRIARAFERQPGHVALGPGDDAALLRVPAGRVLVTSQDDLVEGTHFERRWADPFELAFKLMGSNVSDLAAMGAVKPLGCMISAGFPGEIEAAWCEAFLRGVRRASKSMGTPVVGGNLARSEKIFFSLAVMGTAKKTDLVRREGARIGDVVGGVGPLGEAAAGLALLRAGRKPGWARRLLRAFWRPRPQLEVGKILARRASSMMDNSDGLARSVKTLMEASGVGMRIDLNGVPASSALKRWCEETKTDLRGQQWRGGEDYGLVFTATAGNYERIERELPAVYRLGEVTRRGLIISGIKGKGLAAFEHFGETISP